MPPKSRSRKRTRAPSSPSQMVAPPTSIDPDPAFDFLANVPSPVTLPPSQGTQHTQSGAAAPSMPPPSAPLAAPPSITESSDPYAFMAKVPSPVNLPSVSEGQQSVATTDSHAVATPVPAAPDAHAAPSSTIQTVVPTGGGDPAFAFLAKVPSPVTLPTAQAVQGANTVCTCISISVKSF